MAEESIENSIKTYLKYLANNGIPDPVGILFGSHAKGTNHGNSDIDLVVISSKYDRDKKWMDKEFLFITTARTCSSTEPIPCGVKEWIEDDSRAIIEIARRECVEIQI